MEKSHGKATRPLVKLSSWSESERTFSRTLRGQLWGTIANCLRWESINPMWTMGKSREGGKGGRAQHGETLGRRTARDGDLERHGSTTRGWLSTILGIWLHAKKPRAKGNWHEAAAFVSIWQCSWLDSGLCWQSCEISHPSIYSFAFYRFPWPLSSTLDLLKITQTSSSSSSPTAPSVDDCSVMGVS